MGVRSLHLGSRPLLLVPFVDEGNAEQALFYIVFFSVS